MAYFSNGSEGMAFDEQCAMCKFGDQPCPIACVQTEYNYEAVENYVASKILDGLVKNDGTCLMLERFEKDLKIENGERL